MSRLYDALQRAAESGDLAASAGAKAPSPHDDALRQFVFGEDHSNERDSEAAPTRPEPVPPARPVAPAPSPPLPVVRRDPDTPLVVAEYPPRNGRGERPPGPSDRTGDDVRIADVGRMLSKHWK